MKNKLYIVVPCYNEEEILQNSAKILYKKVERLINEKLISNQSKILFVNDGSNDKTWEIINELCMVDQIYAGISLSHNEGHQKALLAGLMIAMEYADIAVSIDADLQDDIDAIDDMVKQYIDGKDIVFGVRKARTTDTFFKRATAESFYKIMNIIGGETVHNHADFRLMSKKALNSLFQYKEVNIFLRGVVPMLGYEVGYVYYDRKERVAGKSKYPMKKMIAFAWEGVTSLSTFPIKLITGSGCAMIVLSFLMTCYSMVRYFARETVSGWSSIIISIWLIGGLLQFGIGIVGEYVGKTYLEAKGRPRFNIDKIILSNSDAQEGDCDER